MLVLLTFNRSILLSSHTFSIHGLGCLLSLVAYFLLFIKFFYVLGLHPDNFNAVCRMLLEYFVIIIQFTTCHRSSCMMMRVCEDIIHGFLSQAVYRDDSRTFRTQGPPNWWNCPPFTSFRHGTLPKNISNRAKGLRSEYHYTFPYSS